MSADFENHASRSPDDRMEVDLLVVGGGMAGMTAAAKAASCGLAVAVVEKSDRVGGSAALSAGGILGPVSFNEFRQGNPGGSLDLNRVLFERYDDLVEWISSLGVDMTQRPPAGMTAMADHFLQRVHEKAVDIAGYLERCTRLVLGAGGVVVTSAVVERLLTDASGRVRAARVADRDGVTEVEAGWTLLATGGFQNNRALLTEALGDNARYALIRSNPTSAGDGLRLAEEVGAARTEHMDRFYGHPMVAPLTTAFGPQDYTRIGLGGIAPYGIVLDCNGERTYDESLGYWYNAQRILQMPNGRGLVVADSGIDESLGSGSQSPFSVHDRVDEALRAGGHAVRADRVDELDELVKPWGFTGVAAALTSYNTAVRQGSDKLVPPRSRNRRPLDVAPYMAIETQAAITFTFGGIQINSRAEVLDASGQPIPGLLAAGADAGGFYHEIYAGGLSMSGVMALQAVDTVHGRGAAV